jgi:hypothetical protein
LELLKVLHGLSLPILLTVSELKTRKQKLSQGNNAEAGPGYFLMDNEAFFLAALSFVTFCTLRRRMKVLKTL